VFAVCSLQFAVIGPRSWKFSYTCVISSDFNVGFPNDFQFPHFMLRSMATIRRFEDLEIWQLARTLYKKLSVISGKLKVNHDFRFADQLKAAAGSTMDNIAEGFGRASRLEFLNSLSIAKGECSENQSQIYRLFDDEYISKSEFDQLYKDLETLIKQIGSLIDYLNRSTIKGMKFKDRMK
jgi:four helix bundle protein